MDEYGFSFFLISFFLFPGNMVSIMACREVYMRCMKAGRARNESSWATIASLIGRIGYSHVMEISNGKYEATYG